MTPEQQKAAMETMQQWRIDATQLPQPGLLATFWDDVRAYQEGRLQDIEPGLREDQAYMAQLATAPHLSGATSRMDIVYTCSQCGHMQTRKASGLYTANVPAHCGLVMIAKRQEPNDDTKGKGSTVGEVRTAIVVDTNGQPGEIEMQQGQVTMTHVALVSMDGHIDAAPAPSYEAALHLLRQRAETWDWEIDPEQPLDRSTATIEQLSALYAHDAANEGDCWVDIAEVWPHGLPVSHQPNGDGQEWAAQLEALVRDYYTAAQIGAAMEDPTYSDEQDYNARMRALMQRTEALLQLEREAQDSYKRAMREATPDAQTSNDAPAEVPWTERLSWGL